MDEWNNLCFGLVLAKRKVKRFFGWKRSWRGAKGREEKGMNAAAAAAASRCYY